MEQASDIAQFLVAPVKAALPAPDTDGYKLAAVHATITSADLRNSDLASHEAAAVLCSNSSAGVRASSAQGGARNVIEYGVRAESAACQKKGKKKKNNPCAHQAAS